MRSSDFSGAGKYIMRVGSRDRDEPRARLLDLLRKRLDIEIAYGLGIRLSAGRGAARSATSNGTSVRSGHSRNHCVSACARMANAARCRRSLTSGRTSSMESNSSFSRDSPLTGAMLSASLCRPCASRSEPGSENRRQS